MERRQLGKTELNVSTVGFGSAPIGYLEVAPQEADAILNAILDMGVNVIDTAASYPGSEEAIGRAIAHRRSEFILVSKCGFGGDAEDPSWMPENLRSSVERSLKRLKTEYIDVMLLHSCALPTLEQGDAVAALVKERNLGNLRFIGYSGDNDAAEYAARIPEIDVIESSINICDQSNIDRVLPIAAEQNLGIIAKRPLANAAWKDLRNQPGMYASYAKTYTERLAKMEITPERLGLTESEMDWPEFALRFTLSVAGVHTAIVGSTNLDHLRANVAAAEKGPLADRTLTAFRDAFKSAQARDKQEWPGET